MDGGDVQRQNGNLSVLSVPITACDRRALSEAWYCALHNRRTTVGIQEIPQRRALDAPRFGSVKRIVDFVSHHQNLQHQQIPRQATEKRRFFCVDPHFGKRALSSTPLAKRIEAVFFTQPRPPNQATFTLEDGRTRVHIVLRSSRENVHLVALCTAPARTVVEKALDEIQRRLRYRGLQLRSSLTREIAQ